MLTDIADNANSVAHQQKDLTMAADFTAKEALNVSTMAFDNLCLAIDMHNTTSDLVNELNSQDVVNVQRRQLGIDELFMLVQRTTSEHNVFETSQQLIDRIANINIPYYNVGSLNSTVHDVIQNVTELITSVEMLLDELEALEEQANNLSNIVDKLLEMRTQLEEEAGEWLMSLNELFSVAEQNIKMAQSDINDIKQLHDNLTEFLQLFNNSITDVVIRLEEAEHFTEVANNVSVSGQNSLNNTQQLRDKTDQLLDGAIGQLTDINETLEIVSVIILYYHMARNIDVEFNLTV